MMTSGSGGSIVNIASTVGVQPSQSAASPASKAGLIAMTRSAAQTYGPRIRVDAISPGSIERPGLRESWPEGVTTYECDAPRGCLGVPDDIASAAIVLASPVAAG